MGFVISLLFTDDFSRYGYIYPIREKSEALDKFKIFKAEVENQHELKIMGDMPYMDKSPVPLPSSFKKME